MIRTRFLFVLNLAFGLMLSTADAAERLVVLTAYPEDVVSRYQAAFKKVRPDIDLEILWRMPRDALPYLRQTRQGGVDVYWSAAYANFLALKAEHAWRKLAADRAAVPGRVGEAPIADPEGYFAATEMAGYGFGLNPEYLRRHSLPAPKTWEDLARPEFEGHLLFPIPSKVGFAPMLADLVFEAYGWDKGWALLSEIAANSELFAAGGPFLTDVLASGKKGIAVSLDFFFASAIANGAPLSFAYPDRVGYSPAHVAITASSGKTEAAKAFVEFLLSKEGQAILFHPDIRKLPVRPDVYRSAPAGYFRPFEQAGNGFAYDAARNLARLPLVSALFDAVIANRHERLKSLWALVRRAEAEAKRLGKADMLEKTARARALAGSVPVSESAAEALKTQFKPRPEHGDAQHGVDAAKSAWQEAIERNAAEAERLAREVLTAAGQGGGA
ncbi:ABC transporter substrate-binding protein [Methylocaldum szegediense]|uniref:ABC transporter substrate-binding protein n=1 Tax=Methylocaldum szegediense TaxID=73780 RepID=UPI0003FAC1E6|nr:extracellular solute-binding protein [Methylocaldum szegediense]